MQVRNPLTGRGALGKLFNLSKNGDNHNPGHAEQV